MRTRSATLVVIEFGASWPRWLHPAASGDLAVVAQHYEGPPTDLVAQVANRVQRLTQAGWHLDAVTLVVNGRTDRDATAARSVLTRGLMAHLKAAKACHLTLSVSETLGVRAVHELMALAASLEPMARASEVVLGARVGDDPPIFSRPPERALAATG